MSDDDPQTLSQSQAQKAAALGIGSYTQHLLLCVGPKCCSETAGLETWTFLKTHLRELARDEQHGRQGRALARGEPRHQEAHGHTDDLRGGRGGAGRLREV